MFADGAHRDLAPLDEERNQRGQGDGDHIPDLELHQLRKAELRPREHGARREPDLADGGGEPVWSRDFEPAEDLCRRPRHDYFASYKLRLPANVPVGTYRLRLTQADLVAGRETTRDLVLTVRP